MLAESLFSIAQMGNAGSIGGSSDAASQGGVAGSSVVHAAMRGFAPPAEEDHYSGAEGAADDAVELLDISQQLQHASVYGAAVAQQVFSSPARPATIPPKTQSVLARAATAEPSLTAAEDVPGEDPARPTRRVRARRSIVSSTIGLGKRKEVSAGTKAKADRCAGLPKGKKGADHHDKPHDITELRRILRQRGEEAARTAKHARALLSQVHVLRTVNAAVAEENELLLELNQLRRERLGPELAEVVLNPPKSHGKAAGRGGAAADQEAQDEQAAAAAEASRKLRAAAAAARKAKKARRSVQYATTDRRFETGIPDFQEPVRTLDMRQTRSSEFAVVVTVPCHTDLLVRSRPFGSAALRRG